MRKKQLERLAPTSSPEAKEKHDAEIDKILDKEHARPQQADPVSFCVDYSLSYDIGVHRFNPPGWGILKKMLGCKTKPPKPEPLAQYGVGLLLYFKYLKFMIVILSLYSVIAVASCYVNWHGSAYPKQLKADFLADSTTRTKYGLFFTSLGSWGEKYTACSEAVEGSTIELKCPRGVFTSVRAFYGALVFVVHTIRS